MSESTYFKIGDTFLTPARLYNTETDEGIEITQTTKLSSRITNKIGTLIADCIVTPYSDQNLDKGWFTLYVADTSNWNVGDAVCDIKLEDGSTIKHSQTFCFKIVKSITP